jgi:hypothetical protein
VRKFLSAESVANDIMMTRSNKKDHSALLLEGPDDLRVYENFLHSQCIGFPLDGQDQVLGAAAILRHRKQLGIAGIVDADCGHLEGAVFPPNILVTDERDLETLLVNSPALEKVLRENQLSREKTPDDLRDKLVGCCKDLGYLRCGALRKKWHLDFKNLEYAKFVDLKKLTTDRVLLVKEVLAKNLGFGATADDLVQLIREQEDARHRSWQVVAGHDLTSVLALWISSLRGFSISYKIIESQLRLAYEGKSFITTKLYKQIRAWEQANDPFRLVKDEI